MLFLLVIVLLSVDIDCLSDSVSDVLVGRDETFEFSVTGPFTGTSFSMCQLLIQLAECIRMDLSALVHMG